MKKRVHLHVKYVENSDALYKTQDIVKYLNSRLSAHYTETQTPKSEGGVLQFYVVDPEFSCETKKAGNRTKNKKRNISHKNKK